LAIEGYFHFEFVVFLSKLISVFLSKLISVSDQNKNNRRFFHFTSPFFISLVYSTGTNDWRIVRMTRQLEQPDSPNDRTAGRPESQNDQKAGATRKGRTTGLIPSPIHILAEGMFIS
jgi:hypothetical protein